MASQTGLSFGAQLEAIPPSYCMPALLGSLVYAGPMCASLHEKYLYDIVGGKSFAFKFLLFELPQ